MSGQRGRQDWNELTQKQNKKQTNKKQQQTLLETEDKFLTGSNYIHSSKSGKNQGGVGYLQHSQYAQGVLLDVQGPQHRVQVGQIFGQQLPTLVDQLTQLSHLAWGGQGAGEQRESKPLLSHAL